MLMALFFPHSVKAKDRIEFQGNISAYSPSPDQTDDTPFINAMGLLVKTGDVANNCLPFGSKVQIYGKTYTVRDRMNKRYGCDHFDILMLSYDDAVRHGRQISKVTLLSV